MTYDYRYCPKVKLVCLGRLVQRDVTVISLSPSTVGTPGTEQGTLSEADIIGDQHYPNKMEGLHGIGGRGQVQREYPDKATPKYCSWVGFVIQSLTKNFGAT